MTATSDDRDIQWRRVDGVFSACLDLPGADREAWLSRECATEPHIQTRVLELLAASNSADSPLEHRDLLLAELMPLADVSLLVPGSQLGEYRIQRLLGEGGMARVYLAEQQHADWQRLVAIKVLSVGGSEMLARFHDERRILASLEHAGIARLIDAGTTDDDLPFLVTEFVQGESIHRYCERLALSTPARLDLFLQLADAVQHAHSRLVVHRDIKPSNVLVDDEGRVRLLDFGIAKLVEEEKNGPTTRIGQLPMTPEYAAPEQLGGGAISTAIDVYQLGLMLFELIVGQPPWKHWASAQDLATRRLPSASTVAISLKGDGRQRAGQLRGDLDAIIARATASQPCDRYATVQAMAADIRCHLRGQPTSVRRESLYSAIWRFVRSNRVASAASLLFLAAVLGWGATMQVQNQRLERERQAVAREALNAQQARAFLLDVFQQSDPLLQGRPAAEQLIARRWLPHVEADARRALAESPGVQAAVFESIAQLYTRSGRDDDAERVLRDAIALHEQAGDPASFAKAGVQAELASLLAFRGKNEEARALLDAALAPLEPMTVAAPGIAVAVLLDAGTVLGAWGEHQARAERMHQLIGLLAVPGNASPIAEAEARLQLSGAMTSLGDGEAAVAASSLALDKATADLGPTHARLAAILSSHAKALGMVGRADEAEAAMRRALDIQLLWDLPASATVLSLRNNLAIALGEAGRREAEQVELRLLLDLRREAGNTDSIEIGRNLQNLGASLAKTGDHAAAVDALHEASRIFNLHLAQGHPQRAFPHITLALVHLQSGEPTLAQSSADLAAAELQDALPETHYAHAIIGCLRAEARYAIQANDETGMALRQFAEQLDANPSAPPEYRQRCRDAARTPP
ncbi:serine/threonine protein kinase [Arenimonas alkanexedens]